MYKPTVIIANGMMSAGGTETLIMELLRHRSDRINYILLIHYQGEVQKGLYDDEILSLGVRIVHIPSIGTVGVKEYCKKFKEIISTLGHVDVVHSHLNANGGIINMAAKRCGITNRITHCHADIRFRGNILSNIKSELSLQILRILVNWYSTDTWACSQSAWKRLFYPWKTTVVIPNMIDVEKYLSTEGDKNKVKEEIGLQGKIILGAVGRVARIKNYEFILKLIAQLKASGTDAHFVCYGRFNPQGDKYCSELVSEAEQLGVTDNIHFMGNSTNVSHDIRAFDVFLMPSITEGFGMAAIEAQAAGIPVILSKGVPKIVDLELGLAHFAPLDNLSLWIQLIRDSLVERKIDNDTIVSSFNRKGYNSRENVKKIEDMYIRMLNIE